MNKCLAFPIYFGFLLLLFPVFCISENVASPQIPPILQQMNDAIVSLKNVPKTPQSEESVCYDEVGCFSNTAGPLAHIGYLPEPPRRIGTRFFVYQRENPNKSRLLDWQQAKGHPGEPINPNQSIAILIHGFKESAREAKHLELKNALLSAGNDEETQIGTVIMVDWEEGADMQTSPLELLLQSSIDLLFGSGGLNMVTDYKRAAVNCQLVGRQVALLVEKMRRHWKVDPARVHLIGFSLGAQVAGFAGKYSQAQFGWTFGRISGLDAAWPLFENFTGSHLVAGDATWVDGIHTSAGTNILLGEVGFTGPYGTVDFYPAGGSNQPSCTSLFDLTCNHNAATVYYVASLQARQTCQLYGYADRELLNSSKDGHDTVLGYYSVNYPKATGKRFAFPSEAYPFCGHQKKTYLSENWQH